MLSKLLRVIRRIQSYIYHNYKFYRHRIVGKCEFKTNEVFGDNFYKTLVVNYCLNDVVEVANELLENKLRYYSNVPVAFDKLESAWFTDIYSGYKWDEKKYFKDTVIRPIGQNVDIKVPWEVSRLHHLVILAISFRETKNELYRNKLLSDLICFINCNPPGYGPNWVYSMEVAIRITNIIIALDFAFGTSDFKNKSIVNKYLIFCIEHIIDNMEWRGAIRNNHYFISLFGLYIASRRFDEYHRYCVIKKFSSQEMVNEVTFHILPDGGGSEHSTSYHRLNLEMLTYFFYLSDETSFSLTFKDRVYLITHFLFLPPDLKLRKRKSFTEAKKRYFSGIDFLNSITLKDGTYPLVGDNDSGRIIKISKNVASYWSSNNYFSSFMLLGNTLTQPFENKSFLLKITEGQELINKIKKIEGVTLITNLRVVESGNCLLAYDFDIDLNISKFYFYKDFGLFLIKNDDFLIAIRLPVSRAKIPGHYHEDSYTVNVFFNKEWILKDNGTYSYNYDRNEYFHNKRMQSHNFKTTFEISNDCKVCCCVDDNLNFLLYDGNNLIYKIVLSEGKLSLFCNKDVHIENKCYYNEYLGVGIN